MLKLLTTAYFALFLAFSPVQANPSEYVLVQGLSSTAMAREVVVKLVSQDPLVGSTCSAVVISAGKALTAAHCIDIPQMALVYDDGRVFPVLVALPDVMGRDLATLFVPGLLGPTATLADTPVQADELVYAVGYPYGIGNVLTIGQFQFRVTNPENGQNFLISTVMVGPGNSGGALFVVRDGVPYLVGIVVAYAGSPHLAVSVELP